MSAVRAHLDTLPDHGSEGRVAIERRSHAGSAKLSGAATRGISERPPGERRYYELDADIGLTSAPLRIWVNEERLLEGYDPDANKPFRNIQFREPPKIAFDRKRRRGQVRDADTIMVGIWLVSDRLKALLERLDPEAFVFVQAEVDYSNLNEAGPALWFCDIIRMLDCVDEEHSIIRYQQGISWKNYLDLVDIKMRPEVVGSAHAFRLRLASLRQIVDDVFVEAIRKEMITGLLFTDIQRR
jgi:hypothetical protein